MKLNRYLASLYWVACILLFGGCWNKEPKEPGKDPDQKNPQKVEQDILPEGKPYTVPELNLKMIWVPAGKFMMGSPKSEPGHQTEEENLHQVIISRGFWVGQFEITQSQYEMMMGENPSIIVDPRMPVQKVSWENAMEFCKELTSREMQEDRLPEHWIFNLPTEAQWEYACRADISGPFHFGYETDELADYAWFHENSSGSPKPGGLKKPNSWGIHDMHGNLGEWCFDWYGKVYPPDGSVDPITEKASRFKVFRGGTYTDLAERCRAAYRNRIEPSVSNPWIGFRVVLMRSYFE